MIIVLMMISRYIKLIILHLVFTEFVFNNKKENSAQVLLQLQPLVLSAGYDPEGPEL